MHPVEQMIAAGYRIGAPSQTAETIDAEEAAKMRCPRCGHRLRYQGYHRRGQYIALAVCPRCGHELEF